MENISIGRDVASSPSAEREEYPYCVPRKKTSLDDPNSGRYQSAEKTHLGKSMSPGRNGPPEISIDQRDVDPVAGKMGLSDAVPRDHLRDAGPAWIPPPGSTRGRRGPCSRCAAMDPVAAEVVVGPFEPPADPERDALRLDVAGIDLARIDRAHAEQRRGVEQPGFGEPDRERPVARRLAELPFEVQDLAGAAGERLREMRSC